ncbi:MAG TPA: hypothetical protein VMF50_00735 [Candidatus Binataceae bacterium]|nr:hypothetical protein [Candidatus Binataceae bacterium]
MTFKLSVRIRRPEFRDADATTELRQVKTPTQPAALIPLISRRTLFQPSPQTVSFDAMAVSVLIAIKMLRFDSLYRLNP